MFDTRKGIPSEGFPPSHLVPREDIFQSNLVLGRVSYKLGLGLIHKVCGDTHTNRHPKRYFLKEGMCEDAHA